VSERYKGATGVDDKRGRGEGGQEEGMREEDALKI